MKTFFALAILTSLPVVCLGATPRQTENIRLCMDDLSENFLQDLFQIKNSYCTGDTLTNAESRLRDPGPVVGDLSSANPNPIISEAYDNYIRDHMPRVANAGTALCNRTMLALHYFGLPQLTHASPTSASLNRLKNVVNLLKGKVIRSPLNMNRVTEEFFLRYETIRGSSVCESAAMTRGHQARDVIEPSNEGQVAPR